MNGGGSPRRLRATSLELELDEQSDDDGKQRDTLDEELTVRENLVVYARYFGIPKAAAHVKADELLDFAQLTERAGSKVEPLSGGMKRRLTIARSLVNDP